MTLASLNNSEHSQRASSGVSIYLCLRLEDGNDSNDGNRASPPQTRRSNLTYVPFARIVQSINMFARANASQETHNRRKPNADVLIDRINMIGRLIVCDLLLYHVLAYVRIREKSYFASAAANHTNKSKW